jgi:hypothetical protein
MPTLAEIRRKREETTKLFAIAKTAKHAAILAREELQQMRYEYDQENLKAKMPNVQNGNNEAKKED